MKIIGYIFLFGVVLLVTFFVINTYTYPETQIDDEATAPIESEKVRYTLEAHGISFSYTPGTNGYVLEDLPLTSETSVQPTRMIRLVPTSDWKNEQTRVGGEGSPAWLLTAHPNELGLDGATI